MMPVEHDLFCYQGESWSQKISFKESGEPIDLTGITAKAQIRPSENSPTVSAEMECSVLGKEGKIILSLTAEQTVQIHSGSYRYDLQVTKNSDVQYYICGKFIVRGSVTK